MSGCSHGSIKFDSQQHEFTIIQGNQVFSTLHVLIQIIYSIGSTPNTVLLNKTINLIGHFNYVIKNRDTSGSTIFCVIYEPM